MATSTMTHLHGGRKTYQGTTSESKLWRYIEQCSLRRGGLYSAYSVAHAQFMWDAKTEPGVVKIFEEIWGTDKLTVSFGKSQPISIGNAGLMLLDGSNFSVPLPKEQLEDGGAPWPHMDQSPLKPQLASIQGILNLLPNGPKDGGLTVVTGSTKYFKEIWDYFQDKQVSTPRCEDLPLT